MVLLCRTTAAASQAVVVAPEGEFPLEFLSLNKVPHVTISCISGAQPSESNALLSSSYHPVHGGG